MLVQHNKKYHKKALLLRSYNLTSPPLACYLGVTPWKYGWGCAAHSFETLPYFRPNYVIFPTLFQTCPGAALVFVDIWERPQMFDINQNTLLRKKILKKELLLKTIPNSRPDRTNITLFQIKRLENHTFGAGHTYLAYIREYPSRHFTQNGINLYAITLNS